MTRDNNLLGKFELTGIPPAPRGVPKIDVAFKMDANGILHVSATDQTSGASKSIEITNDKNRLSKEDIDRMIKEEEMFREEDERVRERVEMRNSFENYVYSLKNSLNEPEMQDKISVEDRTQLDQSISDAANWLDANQTASKEEIEGRRKEFEDVVTPIMQRLYSSASSSTPHQQEPYQDYRDQNCGTSGVKIEEVD